MMGYVPAPFLTGNLDYSNITYYGEPITPERARELLRGQGGKERSRTADVESPHENDTIQRLSEAYRKLKK